MKAPFMGGAFPFPVKYGYANVSRVEAGEAAFDRARRCFRSIRINRISFCRPMP